MSCNREEGAMAVLLLLMVGYLQLNAGKHTQERFSLDKHNTTSKDECEIRTGTAGSWQHAVIAKVAAFSLKAATAARASFRY
jgi:hypothetical protein